ncbi:DNA adenine methylase [Eubacteriaceae bacterium ES2]|nr:DNA adenine methylase [Eubacteriaceae bacterium ES2]
MNSFIPWIGGKRLLRKTIIEMFPKDFNRYIEVFGGAGWVMFGKDKHADLEIYNDFNGQLANLFRCVKYHPDEVKKEISCILNSREFFDDFKSQLDMRGLTDIQRAGRYFMIIKTSYAADRKTFGGTKKNLIKSTDYLSEISERLNGVIIENRDFERIIKVHDRPDALFYLDPPYHGTEKYYQTGFDDEDHIRLKDCLQEIKGRFILSYNNDNFVRELYHGFNLIEVSRRNSLLERYYDKDKEYKEVIITNY